MSKFSFLSLIILVITFFTGCEQAPYNAVRESVCIVNNSDGTIYLKFDSVNFIDPYYVGSFDEGDRKIISDSIPRGIIPRGMEVRNFITYHNYNLIMRDTTFTRIILGIRIYKILNGDTIYINPEKYNRRALWKQWVSDCLDQEVLNVLEVNNAMF